MDPSRVPEANGEEGKRRAGMNDQGNSPDDARGDGYRRDVTTTFVPVSATVPRLYGLFTLVPARDNRDDVDNKHVRSTVY